MRARRSGASQFSKSKEKSKKNRCKTTQRKKSRNAKKVAAALNRLAGTAEANSDLMPAVMEAVRAEATVGEICEVFRTVYGGYREAVIYEEIREFGVLEYEREWSTGVLK